jgi:transposase
MEHVAIDLGARESQICRRASDGTIVEEKRGRTAKLGEYLATLPKGTRVIVETCTEAFRVADVCRELGMEVRVVPATLSHALGVGARGVKTDVRDARALSEASCRMELPSVHIPSKRAREWKAQSGMRDCLVTSRTQFVNAARAWLRRESVLLKRGSPETLPERMRAWATENATELPACVERLLSMIEELSDRIAAADAELARTAKSDELCRRLMTVPGIGAANAVLYKALIDERKRFGSAHQVASYVGLTPGENSSSAKTRRTSITKAGSPSMRRLLVQAAHSARQWRPYDPMVVWSRRIEERRGRRVAVTALARKLSGILYALWRDGGTYDPARGAAPPEEPPDAMEEALAMLR